MNRQVLVADCDPVTREILAALLPTFGAEPLFADNDEMAVRLFLERGPRLVWIDVLFPRHGGLAFLHRLRGLRDGPAVPVVVAGAVAQDKAFRKEALGQLGALAYCKKPLLLEPLRARLAEVLARGEPPPAVPNPFAALLPEPGGELAKATAPRLLQRLAEGRVTGCLTVTCQRRRKVLYVRDGALTFALSNQLRETLSGHLLAHGRIDPATLEAGVAAMRSSGTRLGEFLIGRGVLPAEEVFAAIRTNVRDKVLDLFRWQEGHYQVTPYREPPAPLPGSELSLAEVVWSGVREVLPRERLTADLTPLGTAVLKTPTEAPSLPAELGLAGGELRLLRTLRRGLGTTVAEVLAQVHQEPGRRLLYYLLLSGYFTLGDAHAPHAGGQAGDPRVQSARDRLSRLRQGNYFQVLHVPLDADDRTVREAYRTRAKEVHPDVLGREDPGELHRLFGETFQVLRNAYEGLKAATVRQQYLRRLHGEAAEDPLAEGNAALQAEVHYQEGWQWLKRREWRRAAVSLSKAWELNAAEGEYALALGLAQARLAGAGSPDLRPEAQRLLRRAHELLPNSGEPAYQLGRLALECGDPGAAVGLLQQALARESNHLGAQRELRLLRLRGTGPRGRSG